MKNKYQDPKELSEELIRSQRSGQPSVRLCEIFRCMAEHFLHSPRYARYPPDVKEDLVSACLIKCIKSIKNYKPDDQDSNPFSYYTRTIETTIWTQLKRRAKYSAMIDELTKQYLREFKTLNPQPEKRINREED